MSGVRVRSSMGCRSRVNYLSRIMVPLLLKQQGAGRFQRFKNKIPDVATEAIGWDPEQYYRFNKRLNWKCKTCGHPWTTTPNKRTKANATGCPECAKKKMGGTKIRSSDERDCKKKWKMPIRKYDGNHSNCCGSAPKGMNQEATPAHVKSGTWCPVCAREKQRIEVE